MLFINDQVKTVEQFVNDVEKITGKQINLDDLRKNPSFSRNDGVKSFNLATFLATGRKVPRNNQGDDVFSVFRYFDGNQSYEFRYATRQPRRDLQNGGNLIYTPKAIDLQDDDFGFNAKEFDLSVYIYCHPDCADSPFFKSDSVHRFYHDSISKAVSRKKSSVDKIQESLAHADKLPDAEVKVFAKGLGVDINNNWSTDDIRTELKSFAISNVSVYYTAMSQETVKYLGTIQNAIDEGQITSDVVGGLTAWKFNYGRYKGVQITTVPREFGDPVEYLKNYLKDNIQQYADILININKEAFSNLKAEDYLRAKAKQEVPVEVYTQSSDVMTLDDVVDFNSAKQYLTLSHVEEKQPSQANANKFLQLVLSKEIHDGNINDVIHEYMNKG